MINYRETCKTFNKEEASTGNYDFDKFVGSNIEIFGSE